LDFEQLATSPIRIVRRLSGLQNGIGDGAAEHVAQGLDKMFKTRYCMGNCPGVQMEYTAVLVDGEGYAIEMMT
jgi:hypothetical protein